MFSLRRPSDEEIRRSIAAQVGEPFSYPEVGATRTGPPAGYAVDRYRVQLGRGAAAFALAKQALKRWTMFRLSWIELCWPEAPIEPGTVVAVLARALGAWTLHHARVVYVIDESGREERYGFAYGTLPDHGERGEERFLVERLEDGSVWYDILAFSRPAHPLARLGAPYVRALQRRFGADSLEAMRRALERTAP